MGHGKLVYNRGLDRSAQRSHEASGWYLGPAAAGLGSVGGGGGGTSDLRKTAIARIADMSDAATVTAVAVANGGRSTGGAGSNVLPPFATLPAGSAGVPSAASSETQTTAGSTPRTGGTVIAGAQGTTATGSAPGGAPAGVSGNTYTDPQGRYTFTVPRGWSVRQATDPTVDIEAAPAALRGILQIVSDTIPPGMTLDDYVNGTMDALRSSITNYQDVPNSTRTIAISGLDARRFDFTGSQNGIPLKGAVLTVPRAGNAYTVLIAAAPADFDAVLMQAQVALDSFTSP